MKTCKSKNSNERKSELLGMSYGKAGGILRKSLMFDMAKKLNLDFCYRCNHRIQTVEEFTIEHKNSWQESVKPKEAFFELENIAYSHASCNYAAGTRKTIIKKQSTIISNSGFKGVSYNARKKSNPFRCTIEQSGKTLSLGCYDTAEKAARVFDSKAIELFGEYAVTNEMLGKF